VTPPLQGIAFLVLAHENMPQLRRLLCWLAGAGARCHLHLDARATEARRELLAGGLPRGVRLLGPGLSRACPWGGFGVVEATLALLREALCDPAVRHVCLLSGSHLPIRPAAEVAAWLDDGREHIDLRLAAAEPAERESLRRFWYPALAGREQDSWLLRTLNREAWRLGKRDLARGLRGMTPMVGSQWWGMTAACARHALGFVDANPWYRGFFRRARIPDEAFFQTLIGASPFAARLGPAPSWQAIEDYSPRLVTLADLAGARAEGRPFARKFDARRDAAAVEAALAGAAGSGHGPRARGHAAAAGLASAAGG
jgi:hypothetical protein